MSDPRFCPECCARLADDDPGPACPRCDALERAVAEVEFLDAARADAARLESELGSKRAAVLAAAVRAGVSKAELARRLGVTRQAIGGAMTKTRPGVTSPNAG